MKIYWFVFFFVSVSWASEKPQQKITYYFKYDKIAKKNRVIPKLQSGEYKITDPMVLNQLPKPPLRRQMVINDLVAYMKTLKEQEAKNDDEPKVVGQPDNFKWEHY